MLRKISNSIAKHFSLLIIAAGAGCFFLANIILKEVFTSHQYGVYSFFITFFSLVYMFGLLGLEQVFLRFSEKTAKDTLTTQAFQLQFIPAVIFSSSLLVFVGTYFFYTPLMTWVNGLLFFVATLASVALLFFFNIFRLNGQFVFTQYLVNGWKVILFVVSIIYLFAGLNSLIWLLTTIELALILSAIIAWAALKRKIKFVQVNMPSTRTILGMAIHFFIAITCFSVLLFGDRFIIEKRFGLAALGDYFYLSNLFIAPFSILQNYVGFKQLVVYKTQFKLSDYKKTNRTSFKMGALLAIVLLFFPLANNRLSLVAFNFNLHWYLIVLLLFTGIVRLYSASINAAFEATTNLTILKRVNLLIFCGTLIAFILASIFAGSLEFIAICLLLVWLARCYIQNHYLLRIFETNQH